MRCEIVHCAVYTNIEQVWTAGQVIGLIHDIPTCDALLKRIEKEAVATLQSKQDLYVQEGDVPVSSSGTVGKKTNNPGAEVWGVGKSKL